MEYRIGSVYLKEISYLKEFKHSASCTAISEYTLLLLCYANVDIMCVLYWSQ